jgi:hypothetical protein
MKYLTPKVQRLGIVSVLTAIMLLHSFCNGFNSRMSEYYYDKNAGLNGSFEIVENGFPVNWMIYSPKTIPEGDYDLIIDTTDFKEGKQSLKFLVRSCAPDGGWHSPGFCMEDEANPGEFYKVSFWYINDSSEFIARIGGVGPSVGEYETIIKSNESNNTWKLIEYKYAIPQDMNSIRFELNILQPGSFWIDGLRIDKFDDDDH